MALQIQDNFSGAGCLRIAPYRSKTSCTQQSAMLRWWLAIEQHCAMKVWVVVGIACNLSQTCLCRGLFLSSTVISGARLQATRVALQIVLQSAVQIVLQIAYTLVVTRKWGSLLPGIH